MRLNLHEHAAYRDQFALVEERLNLLFDDEPAFSRVLSAGLSFMHAANAEAKLSLLKSNFFSEELLQAMICGGESYKTGPIDYIWRRLVGRQIVIRATGHMPGAFVDHSLVLPLLLEYLRSHTLPNIFIPPSAFVSRYRDALVAVDVRTAKGVLSRGSGFFAVPAPGAAPKLYTCRHNVDPGAGIDLVAVTTAAGTKLRFGPPALHSSEDIAVIPIEGLREHEPLFRFRDETEMFDDVLPNHSVAGEAIGHRYP